MNAEQTTINDAIYTRGALGPGAFGYGYAGHDTYSGPTSNAVRINSVGQKVEDQADCTRTLFGQAFNAIQGQFENQTRAEQNARLCDRISEADHRNTDGQFRAELRAADRDNFARVQARLDQLADCCCDQKVANAELKAGQAALNDKLDSNQKFNELFAENQSLKTQVACGCNCRGHHGHG